MKSQGGPTRAYASREVVKKKAAGTQHQPVKASLTSRKAGALRRQVYRAATGLLGQVGVGDGAVGRQET